MWETGNTLQCDVGSRVYPPKWNVDSLLVKRLDSERSQLTRAVQSAHVHVFGTHTGISVKVASETHLQMCDA